MKIFYKVHVFTEDDLKFLEEDGLDSIEDIDVATYDFGWDYAQMALIDADSEEVLIWDDNIHTNVEVNIANFLQGYKYSGNEYKVRELVMMDQTIKDNYSGKRY